MVHTNIIISETCTKGCISFNSEIQLHNDVGVVLEDCLTCAIGTEKFKQKPLTLYYITCTIDLH
uniref:Uncharacterized protein n=1 Tax=Anguilla anguilla TaxID=7936 RepID=A0A0E9Q5G7_ANGAN